jgi:hypothetical protein
MGLGQARADLTKERFNCLLWTIMRNVRPVCRSKPKELFGGGVDDEWREASRVIC